jgi:general nucleoside transport system permease protein
LRFDHAKFSKNVNTLKRFLYQCIGPLVALLLSFAAGGVFIRIIGQDPFEIYSKLFTETLGNTYGIGQVLFKATPLIFTGISAAIAFQAGLFNIGAEGQLTVGALFTALAGSIFQGLPAVLLVPLCLVAGFVGGGLWGAVPGIFKAKFGAHEVINTIMMNFIAAALVSFLVNNLFGVQATIHTHQISPAAELTRFDSIMQAFHGSPVNSSLIIALLMCGVMYVLLWKTRLGYELRAMGLSQTAAEYAGIRTGKNMIVAMVLAGGFAGLVGSNFVMGYKHYFELGFSEGVGFVGIAVALLGRNHPVGIILASLFFGVLEYGGLTVNTLVPKELMNILQAIVIILVIVLSRTFDKLLLRTQQPILATQKNV